MNVTARSGSRARRHRATPDSGLDSCPPPPVLADGQRGSGTVLVLILTMLLCFAGVGATLIGAAIGVRHRAETAADLAALSGAAALVRGGSPCSVAAHIAGANGARLHTCRISGEQVEISVRLRPGGPLTRLPAARANARAGPAIGPIPAS